MNILLSMFDWTWNVIKFTQFGKMELTNVDQDDEPGQRSMSGAQKGEIQDETTEWNNANFEMPDEIER